MGHLATGPAEKGGLASVHDVAAYILQKRGPMSTWKLQKLVYYSQAWSLVWDGEPLFGESIQAWANGPVVRDLYAKHRGRFTLDADAWEAWGDPGAFDQDQYDTMEIVLSTYGELTGRQLSLLTHSERPWREARGELGATEPSSNEISQESMAAYYESLDAADVPAVSEIDWKALEAS
jgi:uncharacterized phage-associated protein